MHPRVSLLLLCTDCEVHPPTDNAPWGHKAFLPIKCWENPGRHSENSAGAQEVLTGPNHAPAGGNHLQLSDEDTKAQRGKGTRWRHLARLLDRPGEAWDLQNVSHSSGASQEAQGPEG